MFSEIAEHQRSFSCVLSYCMCVSLLGFSFSRHTAIKLSLHFKMIIQFSKMVYTVNKQQIHYMNASKPFQKLRNAFVFETVTVFKQVSFIN